MSLYARVVLPVLAIAALASACSGETTGQCCRATTEEAKAQIPMPDRPDGSVPRDVVRSNVRFDCDEDTFCASVSGSEPVCTRKCTESTPCPDGFECKSLIQSMPPPPPDGGVSNIQAGDLFCVRKQCSAAADCPEDFACETVHEGRGTVEDPVIKQCVKAEHKCSATP